MSVFELNNQKFIIKVNSLGAELCSVVSNDTGIEYIWQAQKDVWARYAPHLFPIVGKLKDNIFNYQGVTYQLSQHGFARDSEFVCIENTNDTLKFELTAHQESLSNYPFHFSFQVMYQLTDDMILITYKVFNPDNKELFFSVGAHPAFNCPLQSNETFEDFTLEFFDKECLVITQLKDGLLTDETLTMNLQAGCLPVSNKLFVNDALVLTGNQINKLLLKSMKSKHGVELSAYNWPYFGIWTKKDTSQFICLEPWYGIADSYHHQGNFEDKKGIIKLDPFKNFECQYSIRFF